MVILAVSFDLLLPLLLLSFDRSMGMGEEREEEEVEGEVEEMRGEVAGADGAIGCSDDVNEGVRGSSVAATSLGGGEGEEEEDDDSCSLD